MNGVGNLDRNMLLFWEKKAKPVAVKADADMVNDLSNLVDNALKHSAATRCASCDGASVRVQDNGMGVPRSNCRRFLSGFIAAIMQPAAMDWV